MFATGNRWATICPLEFGRERHRLREERHFQASLTFPPAVPDDVVRDARDEAEIRVYLANRGKKPVTPAGVEVTLLFKKLDKSIRSADAAATGKVLERYLAAVLELKKLIK